MTSTLRSSIVSHEKHHPPGGLVSSPVLPPTEGFLTLDGVNMYCIPDYHLQRPFLMSVVSDSDHWMYLSSTGGLTAGRISTERCLFPYETDDKLHQCSPYTGPLTLIRVSPETSKESPTTQNWSPFEDSPGGAQLSAQAHRALYKTPLGNQVAFEETNPQLGLSFRYRWATSEQFGFVRTSKLTNHTAHPITLELIDGLQNLLPDAINLPLQQQLSCLINAYSRCDREPLTNLCTYSLSGMIVDRPVAAVALRATIAWCCGLENPTVLLSTDQFRPFRQGHAVRSESVLKGRRGGFFVSTTLTLAPGESRSWHIVADVHKDHLEVEALRQLILLQPHLAKLLETSIATANTNLLRNIATADGLQLTADHAATIHHQANVLFNNMRGGVFAQHYFAPGPDIADFIKTRNLDTYTRHATWLDTLPPTLDVRQFIQETALKNDLDLSRLSYEYLPITFSRRHGDPSRPWNQFAIRLKNEDGTPMLSYQGNWRDIFQNWEAMSQSFPGFIESIIAKFVNASTVDGFNPYRVTREGIDWEAPSPHDPWANIGYWGDHQVIYLLKLLESLQQFYPNRLTQLLTQRVYSYANVPYRLKDYAAIMENPRDTILYDTAVATLVQQRVAKLGADGRLLFTAQHQIYHVTLAEKLLVTALSKLSNLVLDGGIWMNTQRPEWNDANNALVGQGLSMVTLCHLRRYLAFCIQLLTQAGPSTATTLSSEVAIWMQAIATILHDNQELLAPTSISDRDRKRLLDALGQAFSTYREQVYFHGFSGQKTVPLSTMLQLFQTAEAYLDHAIRANRRPDGLYHGYNLLEISFDKTTASVGQLYEMLEGQVAVLSSGLLSATEARDLMEAMFRSHLYRADQQSFLLYPDRPLPSFFEKNLIPPEEVTANPLLQALLAADNRSIIARDAAGHYHFHGDFTTLEDLQQALTTLAESPQWQAQVRTYRAGVLALFSKVFALRSFTGRSGTMYGYEGLGCIYWHMVSKLLLAAQESHRAADLAKTPTPILRALAKNYYQIRAGLGFNKTAQTYGAFPMDPYSHTPGHSGAQQPGMTGQVKEEILSRLGELGLQVQNGLIQFQPHILRRREFLTTPRTWEFFDLPGQLRQEPLPIGSLGFTFNQVPMIYQLTDGPAFIEIHRPAGPPLTLTGNQLDAETSQAIFDRSGQISKICVHLPKSEIRLE